MIMIVKFHPEITQKELCHKLSIAPSTSTRFVDKLESLKLVTRKVNGKQTCISLTEDGEKVYGQFRSSLANSVVNKMWVDRLHQEEDVTVHDLYAEYPDKQINVEREQQLLLEHDRIVFQFPLYWYSSPSLLKEWQDVVLTYGWAYGSQGMKLHGKEFGLAISTGGAEPLIRREGTIITA
ncbi:hypothetical protein PUR_50350 [Paenibacillus sp. URB8-2]|nr:hypothetical protein PUR_50350 [Paenibacillus sp. URB8-2]